jgi:isoquinoline 1-oxidoreductase beta subunit
MGMSFSDVPYRLANHRVENGPAEAHVRIGWMRSVSNIYHSFAVSSFADELAHAAGRDPKDYLLELLGEPRTLDLKAEGVDYEETPGYPIETGRLRHVIEQVAEKSKWSSRKSGGGHGFGIAAQRSFLSYVATVVEVEVDAKGEVKIPNVWTVVDCGKIVHPERVRGQFEGAAVFGASLALMGEITASDGRVDQSNFHDYPVARMNEAPVQTHVTIVDSDAPPAGVGEPGVPPFAPALCNAIFAATGKRIRELPLSKSLKA